MSTLTHRRGVFFWVVALAIGSCSLISGCDDEEERTVITVPDGPGDPVQQLYQAINDPDHAGALVNVRAGEYVLSADKDDFGQNGYLVPPPGMEIRGQNRYRDVDGDGVWDAVDWLGDGETDFADPETETIIDGSNLEVSRQTDAVPWSAGRPVLALGAGQIVRSLTIRNHPVRSLDEEEMFDYFPSALVGLVVELEDSSAGLQAEIYDCVVEEGIDGIMVGNYLLEPAGRPATFRLEGNITRGHWHGGILPMNPPFHPPGACETVLVNNRVTGNNHGLVAMGGAFPTHIDQTIVVRSIGNIYEGNARGMLLYGGWNGATGNTLELESVGDVIVGNNLTREPWHMGLPGGGVWAIGGVTDDTLATHDNTLILDFLDTVFVKGSADSAEENVDYQSESSYVRRDLYVWGGTCDGPDADGCALAADNVVDVTLHGTVSIGDEETAYEVVTNVFPETVESGTNEVTTNGIGPDGSD